MAEAHAKHHDYHLVDPSPWPLIGSISAFALAVAAVAAMHGASWWWIAPGLIGVFYTMFAWWVDVIKEAHRGDHTRVVQLHLRYGMILFIASEVMFFVAWFWAFFDASLFADEAQQIARVQATGGQWPPADIEVFDPWHLPLLNTLILLTSGTTVTWAHHELREGNRKATFQALVITVALGILFTAFQVYEYVHAIHEGFTIQDGIFGSSFYMATGFHGFHVLVGTAFLAVNMIRAYNATLSPERHVGFEAAAWYWHFVDVVWLFLFVWVYWWGGIYAAGLAEAAGNAL